MYLRASTPLFPFVLEVPTGSIFPATQQHRYAAPSLQLAPPVRGYCPGTLPESTWNQGAGWAQQLPSAVPVHAAPTVISKSSGQIRVVKAIRVIPAVNR